MAERRQQRGQGQAKGGRSGGRGGASKRAASGRGTAGAKGAPSRGTAGGRTGAAARGKPASRGGKTTGAKGAAGGRTTGATRATPTKTSAGNGRGGASTRKGAQERDGRRGADRAEVTVPALDVPAPQAQSPKRRGRSKPDREPEAATTSSTPPAPAPERPGEADAGSPGLPDMAAANMPTGRTPAEARRERARSTGKAREPVGRSSPRARRGEDAAPADGAAPSGDATPAAAPAHPRPAPEHVRPGSHAAEGYAPFRRAVQALARPEPSLLDRARAAASGRGEEPGGVPPMDSGTADAVVMLVMRLLAAKLDEDTVRDLVNSLPPPLTFDALRGVTAWAAAADPLGAPTSPAPADPPRTGGGRGRKLFDVVGAEFNVDNQAAKSLVTAVVRVLKSQCPPERWERVQTGLTSEWKPVLTAV
jgi:uncharacterized protein (DUF2267 family)